MALLLWMFVVGAVWVSGIDAFTTRYPTTRYPAAVTPRSTRRWNYVTTGSWGMGSTARGAASGGGSGGWGANTAAPGYATTRQWGASTPDPAQYRTHYGNSGTISNSHYGYSEMTYYHHIDNPHNYPVVLHFSYMSLENCHQCSCESVGIIPHDFPYDTNVQKFCGSSLPNGNGHVYVQRLGTIAFHAAGHYRSSSFSLRYELLTQGGVGAFGTTPGYGYSTSGGGRIGKSRLVQMLMNMHNQLDALSGEAKLAYDLANENYINNYAKRSVRLTADDTAEDTVEDTVEDVEANVETQEDK